LNLTIHLLDKSVHTLAAYYVMMQLNDALYDLIEIPV